MTTRRAFYVLLVCGVGFAFYLACKADEANRGRSARGAIATSVITGTWKADNGALFQFRQDGTGRSRDAANPQFGINYFEWETDGTDFMIYWAPRGRLRSFIAHMTAVETAVFSHRNLDDDRFTLAETEKIKTRFLRTTDVKLDEAD